MFTIESLRRDVSHPFLRFNNVSSIHEIHGPHRAWFGVLLKHVKKPNTIVISQRNRLFNSTYTIYKRKLWNTMYLDNFCCFWKELFSRLWWTLPYIIYISWSAMSKCASTLKSLKSCSLFHSILNSCSMEHFRFVYMEIKTEISKFYLNLQIINFIWRSHGFAHSKIKFNIPSRGGEASWKWPMKLRLIL